MDATKKRKREADVPLITYDAATRTFDRLFKEASLDGLKDVVRKKLNVSPSIPLYLSQLRDGKSVDLEDDDDFEAFAASAHSASAVKVKVILGEMPTFPTPGETEAPISSSKRKRKKKQKSGKNSPPPSSGEPSGEVATPDSSLATAHPSKKRRVSFAEPSLGIPFESIETPKKKDKKLSVGDSVVASLDHAPETLRNAVADLEEGQTTEPSTEKKRKKKKKQKETEVDSNVEEGQTLAKDDQSVATEGKSKKTKSKDSSDSPTTAKVDPTPKVITINKLSDEASQSKRSKKRSRTSIAPENEDEDGSSTSKLSSSKDKSTEPSIAKDDAERPSKKSKKNHEDKTGSEATAPTVIVLDESAKPKSKTHPSPTEPSDDAPTESRKESKKSRKKDDKVVAEASDSTALAVPESSEPSPPSEQTASKPVAETPSAKKRKKSAASKPTVSEAPTTQKPEERDTVQNSKNSKQNADPQEPKDQPETTSAKKSAEASSRSKEAPVLQPTEVPASKPISIAKTTTSKKSKKPANGAETRPEPSSEGENTGVEKDDANATVIAADAKTPKKGSKKKKDNVEPAGAVEVDKSLEPLANNDNAQDTSRIDVKEMTRLAVEAILKRKADQTKEVDQTQASSSVVVQPEATPSEPKGTDTQQETETDKKAKAPATTTQEKSKSSPTCSICDKSPPHTRSKCPIIKAGIKSMRKRIAELEAGTPEDQEERSKIIAELQGYIEKKTRKPRTSEVAKPISPPEPAPALPSTKKVDVATSTPAGPEPPPATQLPANSKAPPATQLSAGPKSLPATQPSTTQRRSGHPSLSQSPISLQASSSNKAANNSQILRDVFSKPLKTSGVPLHPDLLGFGDVSLYTDQDIEALIRGPKVWVKDVPDSDSDSEEQEVQGLEEDDELEIKVPRNANRVEYPSSSDEGEEEQEETHAGSTTGEPAQRQERELSSGTEERQGGNMSFQDVDACGSSRELDTAGDIAVNDAVEADLAPLNPRVPESSQPRRRAEMEADSDTAVASQAEESHDEQEANTQGPPATPPAVDEIDPDPIEPSDNSPTSQPEPIVSDDEERPMESTPRPKVEVVLRTRSQRNKTTVNTQSSEPKATQPTPSQDKTNDVEKVVKPARKTRSLTKISDLPIPPNPSVRIIRPAPVPRIRRLAAQEESRKGEETPEESNMGTRRSTRAAVTKTPAKMPPKTTKSPAKRASKTSIQASAETRGKTIASNGVVHTKTRSKSIIVPTDPDLEEEPSQGGDMAPPSSQSAVSWAVLQESTPFRADTETPDMVDELLPSPNIMATPSGSNRSKKGQQAVDADGSLPEPLFVPAESQQSFPYSQYPDILPEKGAALHNNDEDDEDEVAEAIVRPAASSKPSGMFRSLSEIASQPTLFVSRLSQQFTRNKKEQVQDLYGQSGRESEESESGSDSEAETQATPSHIPADRRAGAAVGKKR